MPARVGAFVDYLVECMGGTRGPQTINAAPPPPN
ncbi:hypothetical protein ACVIN2_003704 [Bradyrhizobium sp. USDA 3650]